MAFEGHFDAEGCYIVDQQSQETQNENYSQECGEIPEKIANEIKNKDGGDPNELYGLQKAS
jgi:hypothetical protein